VRPSAVIAVFLALGLSAADGAAHGLKGEGPTSIAAAFGSLWVGMGNGHVVRIEPHSGREQTRLRGYPTAFVHGIVAAYGAVWATRGRVVRIDPRRRLVREVRGVGSATLFTIQAGAGAIWVPDDGANEILRIDPKRVKLAARIRVPGRAWGVAAGAQGVVVVSVPSAGPVTGPVGTRLLHRLDPKTNRLSPPLARLDCDAGVTVGYDAVWTFDACGGTLERRDPHTLQVLRQAKLGVLSQTPALGFGSVWLASRGGVLRIDPRTLRVVAKIPGRSLTVVTGATSMWAFDYVHATIRKIDPRKNRVAGHPILVATNP
jgi:streptogramin lyase